MTVTVLQTLVRPSFPQDRETLENGDPSPRGADPFRRSGHRAIQMSQGSWWYFRKSHNAFHYGFFFISFLF